MFILLLRVMLPFFNQLNNILCRRYTSQKYNKNKMVQVAVKEGVLEGEVIENEYGGKFYSFKGIPYATPPVGDLRFKAPQPPQPWTGIRSAKDFGPVCYQVDFAISSEPLGSEDCLYLNVYTPELKPRKPLPVMFYIHGGAFLSGSGNDDMLGPEFLVRHGVILVTINYRLGALGFLCLDTEDIPGNAGMKDQVAAMRWVNKNISNFGGDPNNVTIFGESAGAGSVSFHLVSPMTKGLFRRAIPQSGALTCWWAHSFNPRDQAITLAKKLDFYSEDDKELYNFFKSLPLDKLVQLKLSNTLSFCHKEFMNIYLNIASEKQFGDERYFYGDVFEVLRNGGVHDGVEVMTGYTEHEGYVGLCGMDMERMIDQLNTINDFIVPKPIALNVPLTKQLEVARKLKEFYFKKAKITMEDLDQYIKYMSMDMFVFGAVQLVKIIAKQKKNKVYLYKFTCKSERNKVGTKYMGLEESIFGNKTVVCHADDLTYLFPVKSMLEKVDKKSKTFQIIETVCKLWTNFAKYGNPTPDSSLGVKWTPFSTDNQEYLDIGNKLALNTRPESAEIEFWESIFKEYYPHCVEA